MRVELSNYLKPEAEVGTLTVSREPSDRVKKYYRESTLWYHIKLALHKAGFKDVIKQVPGKDGHLTSAPYYLRTRKGAPGRSFMIHDEDYALRQLYEPYNRHGLLELRVIFDIWEEAA